MPRPRQAVRRSARSRRRCAQELGRPSRGGASRSSIPPAPGVRVDRAGARGAPADGQEVVIKVQRPRITTLVEADLRVLRLAARALRDVAARRAREPRGHRRGLRGQHPRGARLPARGREHDGVQPHHGAARRRAGGRAARDRRAWSRAARARDGAILRPPRRRRGAAAREQRRRRGEAARGDARLVSVHRSCTASSTATCTPATSWRSTDGRIGFLDFGIVGRFARERREQVTDYLMAFASGDFKRLAEVMVSMGAVGTHVDLEALVEGPGRGLRADARGRPGRHQVRRPHPRHPAHLGQARHAHAARLRAR